VYIGCNIFVDFSMHGSYLALLAIFTLGSISLISLGLLVAARSSSEELAGGLLNLISWPMMFLSGVWFSLEGLEPWVQDLAMIFPLTHTISAARAIMIDGASLAELLPQISILAAMSVVFLIIGSLMFKWE
jgi:ABC-type polysaccharide/polyol phosphate export permease